MKPVYFSHLFLVGSYSIEENSALEFKIADKKLALNRKDEIKKCSMLEKECQIPFMP